MTTKTPRPYFQPCTDEQLSTMLCLVGVERTPAQIATWTPEQRTLAQTWAGKTHLAASDHPVRVPPRPDFLPEPWQDEEGKVR